jgi:hypothetical protein
MALQHFPPQLFSVKLRIHEFEPNAKFMIYAISILTIDPSTQEKATYMENKLSFWSE